MNRLFTTTAVLLVLGAGGLQAQTADPAAPAAPAATASKTMPPPEISPPDGFTAEKVVFSAENLDGATVYDATGEKIGEVHGLVFANGTTTMGGMNATATSDMAQPATTTPPATAPTSTEVGGVTGAPTPEPNAGASGQGTAGQMPTDSTNKASGTATADGDAIKNVGSDAKTVTPTDATTPPAQGMAADGTTATTNGTTAATTGANTAANTAGGAPAAASGEITQAVIDVGGFLGMGEHRVAVPIEELVAYRKDTDLRIYLPWTREQLMALPEFDMDGPA